MTATPPSSPPGGHDQVVVACAAAASAEPGIDHTAPQVLASASLLRGQKSVVIEHNGSSYRLQNTRQGKLILTK